MSADLFISYAWTSVGHREWVRLLASQLHQLGYVIQIDEAVDYGSSLSGFMREVTNAKHVLLVVDENYAERADSKPDSGVGIETKWISATYAEKPATWLSVLWVDNPGRLLPSWLDGLQPKGFDFNADPDHGDFPGVTQLNEIWRWVEGLPASTANAVPLAEIRRRAARLERIDALRNPGQYANPALDGRATFRYGDHPHYTIGHDEYEFKVQFSGRGMDSVYVYSDGGLKALGLITSPAYDPVTIENFLRPGRTAQPAVGQMVALLNLSGALCVITIDEVQMEVNDEPYIREHVTFSWKVLTP
ncbi:toll/interleukin-1 receptor domain-containing protein [Arthrobacter sp. AET 35A]|uniref:toll/interleukin-1 receptor domain-containing protein n=1 Tax=Arthrobacter sp. AET 35A TaxID=2292643 RepID=UPI00178108AD|nr:toll/interleukin-1 receptor domain-containing protein [Arthrobacter sp. AET 35A]MBE0011655.1 TIR domain-containing protein [Arthrobacter sp. AET 35A]